VTRQASPDVQSRDRTRAHTHERILQAAIKLFGTVGFENTTIRAVTNRAGTDSAAAHYHYSDKKLLYRRAVEACVSNLLVKDMSLSAMSLAERNPKAYGELIKILAWEILAPSGQNITQNSLLRALCEQDEALLGLKDTIENLIKTTENS
jgi:AcrR family transcriptional regulator